MLLKLLKSSDASRLSSASVLAFNSSLYPSVIGHLGSLIFSAGSKVIRLSNRSKRLSIRSKGTASLCLCSA